MKTPKISITDDGLSTEDKQYMRKLRIDIHALIHELELEYNACICKHCKVAVVNKMDDIITSELYMWIDTLQAPLSAGENIEMDAFDNSLNHIAELQKLIGYFNELRSDLLNS